MYSVNEIYYTLQGEGAQAGRAAVFLRFTGCNLWSGREEDREKAICKFCDTQFVGTGGENGGKYTAEDLATVVQMTWYRGNEDKARPYVVCTGGEPLLQLDGQLTSELHRLGFEIAIETNGTIAINGMRWTPNIDWVCVSPKANTQVVQTTGDELKLVYPQEENNPEDFKYLDFRHFFLSPKNDPHGGIDLENTKICAEYCMTHPQWRLSLQTHKMIGLK